MSVGSMLDYRFPELIHHYDNGEGGNCAIFDDWGKHTDFKVTGYLTRGLQCRWTSAANGVRCFHGAIACPEFVTLQYLTTAPQQGVCQDDPDYWCTAECVAGSSEVRWVGHGCTPLTCPEKRFQDSDFTMEKGLQFEREQQAVSAACRVDVAVTV